MTTAALEDSLTTLLAKAAKASGNTGMVSRLHICRVRVAFHCCAYHPSPQDQCRRSAGFLLTTLSLDNTGGQGGDTFTPQRLGQSGYDEYGTNTAAAGTGPGGIDTQSDRYATSGQYGGPTSQTAGYADSNRNITGGGGRHPEDDDDYVTGVGNTASGVGKPSITSRVKGASLPSVLWSRALAQTDVRVVGL
ncbi:hypothetical protein EDB83DRAFT_1162488 [Lactarius deliciosus]|nr:hypothetical protein EDB83DRAFT_1162488 [Lactarius deliciosus]